MDDNRVTRPIIMETAPRKTRAIILALALVMIGAGVWIWINELNRKAEQNSVLSSEELGHPAGHGRRPLAPEDKHPRSGVAEGPQKTPVGVAGKPKLASAPTPAQPAAQPATPTANTQPPAAQPSTKPAEPKANTQPAAPQTSGLPQKPPPGQPQVAGNPPPAPAVPGAAPGAQPPAAPATAAETLQAFFKPKSIPSTTRLAAAADAKALPRRPDPCEPLSDLKPFPRSGAAGADKTGGTGSNPLAEAMKKFTPPPPPPGSGPGLPPEPPQGDGLSVAELPAPPSKPTVAGKLRLVAIVGDRAIMAFDKGAARENKWPQTLTLGPGEQFESVSIVGVNNDSVTIEEDGERQVKTIESVK